MGACWKNDCFTPARPPWCDVRDLNTLLRRCALCSKSGPADGAGVWKRDAPGIRLFLPLLAPPNAPIDWRCTEGKPSARFVPDEERAKSGWLGRPGASDMRPPDCERAWLLPPNCEPCCIWCTELERFIADEGMGIAEEMLLFMGPKVCAKSQ